MAFKMSKKSDTHKWQFLTTESNEYQVIKVCGYNNTIEFTIVLVKNSGQMSSTVLTKSMMAALLSHCLLSDNSIPLERKQEQIENSRKMSSNFSQYKTTWSYQVIIFK